MLSSEGFVASSDGVRLFYRKFGSNPDTVIIPNAVHMSESFRHLAERRTVIFFDLRNRGASDSVRDSAKLANGIHHDVDDLESVRRHFGLNKVDLIGHSYLGLMVILYALKYPDRVKRLVQIGAVQPNAATQYPAHLTGADATLAAFGAKVAELRNAGPSPDPREACRNFWALVRVLMVFNPADAHKITWTPCDYPNERGFMKHFAENVLPSIHRLRLDGEEISKLESPVLAIHGTKDRQAPYGGGRDWAMMLPDARLVTVENAAHVPWIEAPELVFGSIEIFLDGGWPEAAQVLR